MGFWHRAAQVGGAIAGAGLGGAAMGPLGNVAGGYLGGKAGGALVGGGGGGGMDDQGRARLQQQAFLAQLQGAANGTAPSAAEGQLRMGTDRLMAQQQSIAASQPGMSPAAAGRMASLGTVSAGMGMNQQLAVQRAQEQAQARAQLAAYLEAIRQQDIQNRGLNIQQTGQKYALGAAALGGISSLGASLATGGGSAAAGALGGGGGGSNGYDDNLMQPNWG